MSEGADGLPVSVDPVRERRILFDYWPRNRKTKELEEAWKEDREYYEWFRENWNCPYMKFRAPNGKWISLQTYVEPEKEPTIESLRGLVEPYAAYTSHKFDEAQRANSDLRVRREESTWRSMSAKFVHFSKGFMEFANYYSGLVEIMLISTRKQRIHDSAEELMASFPCYSRFRALDQFLLETQHLIGTQLAAAKQQLEDNIVSSFIELGAGLKEMQIYREIYPNQELGAMIANMYRGTCRFFQRVTEYCHANTLSRFSRIIKPSKFSLELEELTAQISNIRAHCQALLAQQCRTIANRCASMQENLRGSVQQEKESNARCRAIEKQLEEAHARIIGLEKNGEDSKLHNQSLKEKNEDLMKKLQTIHAELDEREGRGQLEKLLCHYGISEFSEHHYRDRIKKCQTNLKQYHDNMYFTQMDLSALQQLPEHCTWNESTTSSILILSGKPHPNFVETSYGFCWVSAPALELINYHLNRKSFIVYELCQLDIHQSPEYSPTARTVMLSLISQLLRKCTHILRDSNTFNRLREIHIHPNAKELGNDISDLTDLLLMILGFLKHHEPIYFVLDRVDRCSNRYSAKRLLMTLLKAVQRSGCRVKVLVVVSGKHMDVADCLEDLDIKEPKSGTFIFKELQQQARAMGQMSGNWK